MSKDNMIRAWKDPEYRSSLNAQECALLPANPAGTIDHAKLAEVAGGSVPELSLFDPCTYRFCTLLCSWAIDCP
jgi:mersacidin/lichenicidin family type 2 lantibiotic